MRAGDDRIILNVSTTTTAFIVPMQLQTWINQRCPGGNLCAEAIRELNGIKVTFDCDPTNRERVIRGFSNLTADMIQIARRTPR